MSGYAWLWLQYENIFIAIALTDYLFSWSQAIVRLCPFAHSRYARSSHLAITITVANRDVDVVFSLSFSLYLF